uniref:CYRIA/CYRIB Rac1 binding domain-containing protein n=1 Tax=Glossina pallidipes TaxID=7398 RepID=A0A1A9Z3I5_GLOPL
MYTYVLHAKKIIIQMGAGKEIREAIADPSPQCQEKAWAAVLPLVIKLKRCYEHSLELEKIVPKLLGQLVGGKLNPTQHLETQQALVKQLAEILEFVLKFDEHKNFPKLLGSHLAIPEEIYNKLPSLRDVTVYCPQLNVAASDKIKKLTNENRRTCIRDFESITGYRKATLSFVDDVKILVQGIPLTIYAYALNGKAMIHLTRYGTRCHRLAISSDLYIRSEELLGLLRPIEYNFHRETALNKVLSVLIRTRSEKAGLRLFQVCFPSSASSYFSAHIITN